MNKFLKALRAIPLLLMLSMLISCTATDDTNQSTNDPELNTPEELVITSTLGVESACEQLKEQLVNCGAPTYFSTLPNNEIIDSLCSLPDSTISSLLSNAHALYGAQSLEFAEKVRDNILLLEELYPEEDMDDFYNFMSLYVKRGAHSPLMVQECSANRPQIFQDMYVVSASLMDQLMPANPIIEGPQPSNWRKRLCMIRLWTSCGYDMVGAVTAIVEGGADPLQVIVEVVNLGVDVYLIIKAIDEYKRCLLLGV